MMDTLAPVARTCPPNVLMATPKDERALYGFLVELHAHNGNGWGWEFDPRIVMGKIETATRVNLWERTNPNDQRRGLIGVVYEGGQIVASVGVFLETPMWFTTDMVLQELWLYVRPAAQGRRHLSRSLRDFALWAKEQLSVGLSRPLSLQTGFVHQGKRFDTMRHLWQRLWPTAKMIGILFQID